MPGSGQVCEHDRIHRITAGLERLAHQTIWTSAALTENEIVAEAYVRKAVKDKEAEYFVAYFGNVPTEQV